jgi:hypothetical protein
MVNHGVNANEQATSVSTPVVATSGIPYFVGTAPIQSAEAPAAVNTPVLCTSWDDAVAALGYSDDWEKYSLCEAMYSHFKLYACQPVIFCNVLDTKTLEAVEATDKDVSEHKVLLPFDAVDGETLTVKTESSGEALKKNTDYAVYYSDKNLVLELLEDSSAYDAEKLNIAYSKIKTGDATTTKAAIVTGIEKVELCLTKVGILPDLILAPRYSHLPEVAAVMAAKAENINGIFKAKVLVDIDSTATGATSYKDVLAVKNKNNITDSTEIACWPMIKLGDRKFHLSTQLAGLMASIDTKNDGCPYESPSNKNLKCDSLVLADGTEVDLTLTEANNLNSNGIVTAINFVNGWTAWGNYTACYPANTDVKDYFIPVSRMFKWIDNTLIKTYWKKVDNPKNRRLVDTVLDAVNIWLNGLTGREFLLGGRVEILEVTSAGKIRFHIFATPPDPAQEFDFITEYDPEYVLSALG